MSSNLINKVKMIQGKIISLLYKKEELEKTDIMYANCLKQTKEKEKDIKELEKFKFFDGIDIRNGIVLLTILKILISLAFAFECYYILILFLSNALFSLPIVETIIYNLIGVFFFCISNKRLEISKKARKISLNCFGDTIYDSKRIKERKDFYRLEKKRLMKKRFEIERETIQNDIDVLELKKILKDVVNTCDNSQDNKSFLETVSFDNNLFQQFMLNKRR